MNPHARLTRSLRVLALSVPPTTDHDVQPADQSTAKAWVKNPGGAICRNDRRGVSPAGSPTGALLLVGSVNGPPVDSAVVNASGLESQPPGSAGRLSRPATVKLLNSPSARAAQRWLKSAVAVSGFCESGMILPPAGEIGD